MSHKSPVGKIRRPDDRVENFSVALTVRLWDCGYDGSLWVHTSAVINITPIFRNISTTIQNTEGKVVPITVSQSGCSVGVDGGWLNSGVVPIFCDWPLR